MVIESLPHLTAANVAFLNRIAEINEKESLSEVELDEKYRLEELLEQSTKDINLIIN